MNRKSTVYRHSSPFYPPYPNAASTDCLRKKRLLILERVFLGALITVSFVFLARLA